MTTRDHNRAANPQGATHTEGFKPQQSAGGGQNQPAILKLTRAEYAHIPADYKSWWTRPDGTRVRVVLRGCPTGGVTLAEFEIIG